MHTQIKKPPVHQRQIHESKRPTNSQRKHVDKRPEAQRMAALQRLAATRARPQDQKIAQLQALADTHTPAQRFPIQRNDTGIPDGLKTGMEQVSGMSLDHVKVYYNSPKPATVQAHAYAQGNQVHLASGQEKHLPHELGHVVQQAKGRVKPTTEVNGAHVNDSPFLEREADRMGSAAMATASNSLQLQKKSEPFYKANSQLVIQNQKDSNSVTKKVFGTTHLVKMTSDGHIYEENYEDNEYDYITDGTLVCIDKESAIRSRRGPNQEVKKNNQDDETGPSIYGWYQVEKYLKPGSKDYKEISGDKVYIRQDVFLPDGSVVESEDYESGNEETTGGDFVQTSIESVIEGLAFSGVTGDYNDINSQVGEGNLSTEGDIFSQDEAFNMNNATVDILEGANAIGGLMTLYKVYQNKENKSNTERLFEGLEASGNIIHGGAKFAKGVVAKANNNDQGHDILGGSRVFSAGQLGDAGAAFADGLAAVSSLHNTIQKFNELRKEPDVDGFLAFLEETGNLTKNSANTIKDISKAVVGSTNQFAHGAASAAAVAGIVVGTIQMIQGAKQTMENSWKNGDAKSVIDNMDAIRMTINGELSKLLSSQELLNAHNIAPEQLKEIEGKIAEISKILEGMEAIEQDAVNLYRISSRKMESGKMKMAGGAVGVVSGALVLSGVGAPIVLGVGALSILGGIGYAGLSWRRNAAYDRAADTASRLDKSGTPLPKKKKEKENLSFKETESRLLKNYYETDNIKDTVDGESTFNGLGPDDTKTIRVFAWNEKKSRGVNSDKDRIDINEKDYKNGKLTKNESELKKNWIRVLGSEKKNTWFGRGGTNVQKIEYPSGKKWLSFKTTASAYQSSKASKSDAEELAGSLAKAGIANWEPGNAGKGDFKKEKVILAGKEGFSKEAQDTMEEMAKSSDIIFKAVRINKENWGKWYDQMKKNKLSTEDEYTFMKNKILKLL